MANAKRNTRETPTIKNIYRGWERMITSSMTLVEMKKIKESEKKNEEKKWNKEEKRKKRKKRRKNRTEKREIWAKKGRKTKKMEKKKIKIKRGKREKKGRKTRKTEKKMLYYQGEGELVLEEEHRHGSSHGHHYRPWPEAVKHLSHYSQPEAVPAHRQREEDVSCLGLCTGGGWLRQSLIGDERWKHRLGGVTFVDWSDPTATHWLTNVATQSVNRWTNQWVN